MTKGMTFSLMNVKKVNILRKQQYNFCSVLCGNLGDIGKFLFYLHQTAITRNESGNACRSSNRKDRGCLHLLNINFLITIPKGLKTRNYNFYNWGIWVGNTFKQWSISCIAVFHLGVFSCHTCILLG